MQMKNMLCLQGIWIQAQDGVKRTDKKVLGIGVLLIERDKIATHEAELIQLTKGMNGNSFCNFLFTGYRHKMVSDNRGLCRCDQRMNKVGL